jgi:hypothetical protein
LVFFVGNLILNFLLEIPSSSAQAADAKVAVDDIAVLTWCDMNAPHARNRESCLALCKGLSALNESNPSKTACVLTLPDCARESNPRGLFDEEKQIFEELYSLNQKCEVRWVDLYTHESKKNNGRRFGTGRIITSAMEEDNNPWLGSELSIYGRVCGENEAQGGAPLTILPRTSAILIPESASPAPRRNGFVVRFS